MKHFFITIFIFALFLGIFGFENLAEAQTICEMTFTDADGETRSANDWCTGGFICTGGNCGDDVYDFCIGNTHYRFGCYCGIVGCHCDINKASSEDCPGGCTNWSCDNEGCSGGECIKVCQCPDGTLCNQCKTGSPPLYCDGTTKTLINKCSTCSCPAGQICQPDGSCAVAPPVCTSDGCNGNCPLNCTVAQDPDCGCQNNNGCCGLGCTIANDNDCPATCTPDGCNGNCPPGCSVSQDSDCPPCTGGNGCCGIGCNSTNDNDCAGPAPTPIPTPTPSPTPTPGPVGIIKIEPPITATSFEALVGGIVNFVFNIALVLAPLMVIIGAIYLLTSAGDPKKIETGKNIILYTLIGLAIILLAKGLIAVLEAIIGVK